MIFKNGGIIDIGLKIAKFVLKTINTLLITHLINIP